MRVHRVATAAELQRACEREFADCDVLLMAAAVADFRPAAPREGKIKKAGRERLDAGARADRRRARGARRARRAGQTLVGFAAEHGAEAVELARGKLAAKGLDAIVVNDISRADIGFDVDANEVTILTAAGEQRGRTRARQGAASPRRSSTPWSARASCSTPSSGSARGV